MATSDPAVRPRKIWSDALALAILHVMACAAVRAMGFDHVSDDDFARVTIAQTFAVAPKLDPTGTSWLPLPFWLTGSLMAVFGRSLEVARTVSVVIASAAFTTPYLAMRELGVSRLRSIGGSVLMLGGAWSIWLGASTVPESMTASIATAGILALRTRFRVPAALALLAACLCRYEAWPVAAVGTIALALDRKGRSSPAILLCALGPLAWMAWNIRAHGDALHFFHRVASFKRELGEPVTSRFAPLFQYPRLLITTRPDVVLAATMGTAALRERAIRARWTLPLVAAAAQLVFLLVGSATDGSPAHHPERALLGIVFVLAAFGADAAPWPSDYVKPTFLAIWLATFLLGMKNPPPNDRELEVARGVALRAAPSLVVTPCAYEHFALLAAYGAPERATIKPAEKQARQCPEVLVPSAPAADQRAR